MIYSRTRVLVINHVCMESPTDLPNVGTCPIRGLSQRLRVWLWGGVWWRTGLGVERVEQSPSDPLETDSHTQRLARVENGELCRNDVMRNHAGLEIDHFWRHRLHRAIEQNYNRILECGQAVIQTRNRVDRQSRNNYGWATRNSFSFTMCVRSWVYMHLVFSNERLPLSNRFLGLT